MFYYSIFAIFLVQSSLAYRQDFLENADNLLSYPDDSFENDNDIEINKRSNHFLRFGRNDEKSTHEFDDYDEFARPTKAGKREKNDHFIRFGRGRQQDFLRFGRDQGRSFHDRENYLRFGRSVAENEDNKKRSKRETTPNDYNIKRNDAFLRFGRNSNFMRFGRDPSLQLMRELQNSEFVRLLTALAAHRQERSKYCGESA